MKVSMHSLQRSSTGSVEKLPGGEALPISSAVKMFPQLLYDMKLGAEFHNQHLKSMKDQQIFVHAIFPCNLHHLVFHQTTHNFLSSVQSGHLL